MAESTAPERFQDPGDPLDAFLDEVLARCPRCDRLARVAPAPVDPSVHSPRTGPFADRRLVCPSCALVRTWPPAGGRRTYTTGTSTDPWFGEPLWLRTDVVGEVLWAYNVRHLDLLEGFIAATQRARGDAPSLHHSIVTRLPLWMKEARHREALLAAIGRLRSTV